MAGLKLVVNLLECDGCAALFGAPNGYGSPMDARAAAYQKGWRFPNQVTSKGNAANTTSDVCPSCVAGWKPQLTGSRARAISRDELAKRTGGVS